MNSLDLAWEAFRARQYRRTEELCLVVSNQLPEATLLAECRKLRARAQLARGEAEAALRTTEFSIETAFPRDPELLLLRGDALTELGQVAKAAACYQEALDAQPDSAEGWNRLGLALARLGRPEAAALALEKTLLLGNRTFRTTSALARALLGVEKLEQAVPLIEDCLSSHPQEPESWVLAADACRLNSQLTQAIDLYTQAIELAPTLRPPRGRRALAHLTLGNYREGWADYEARLERPLLPLGHGLKPWNSGLPPGTVVLWDEQGAGDTIQFARYVKAVRAQGNRTVFYGVPRLLRLLSTTGSFDQVIPRGTPLPPAQYHSSLMSLPLRLGSEKTFSPETPYLFAEPERVAHWRDRLDNRGKAFRVGLVWKGNSLFPHDLDRSPGLLALQPFLRALRGRVSLYALQKETLPIEVDVLATESVTDLGQELDLGPDGFVDTAAVMSNLDLLITSDTSAAHLGGALGIRTWILLSTRPDWRWGLEGELTPWYPTARLLRQSTPGDWHSPLMRACLDLESLLFCKETEL